MTTPTSVGAPDAPIGRLLGELQRFVPSDERRGDRGALAALRRAAGKQPGEIAEADAIVFRHIPPGAPNREVGALFTVATLFAIHQRHGRPIGERDEGRAPTRAQRGLGASLRAVRRLEGSPDEDPGVARRFTAVLDAPAEALPTHLRHLVTLLKSRAEHTPIDYDQLYRDILEWDDPEHRVQRAWASGFWAYDRPSSPDGEAPETTTANDDEQD